MYKETTPESTLLACLEWFDRELNRKIVRLGSVLFHKLRLGSPPVAI